MSPATPTMDAVALAFSNGIVPGPPSDPLELYFQLGIISSSRILTLLWSRDCPVDVNFKHRGKGKRLAVSGVGPWFAPVCTWEAFVWCVAPLSQVQGSPDFPKYPHTPRNTSLAELAEWVRSVAIPGGAESWRRVAKFEGMNRS